jgi:hypothetical protein
MKATKRTTRKRTKKANNLLTWNEQKDLIRVFLDGQASPKYEAKLSGAKFFFFLSLLDLFEEFCKNSKAMYEDLERARPTSGSSGRRRPKTA